MNVTFIDSMGTDLSVVNAARVSFNKESFYNFSEGFANLEERDVKLIKYLANHDHFTPFTHCTITMREHVPIFVARQRFKHVIGFSYNEISRRYVSYEAETYTPAEWRKAASDKKQGSSDETIDINPNNQIVDIYQQAIDSALWTYDRLIQKGVCPEQARMVLPQSTYTEYYVTGSLYAWARAFNLRSSSDAQKEIQDLAWRWDEILMEKFPYSWVALTEAGV
jgi:thymidylate synthase (FAD)